MKESTKELLELINEFSSVAGYKINMQNQLCVFEGKKSVMFLYT